MLSPEVVTQWLLASISARPTPLAASCPSPSFCPSPSPSPSNPSSVLASIGASPACPLPLQCWCLLPTSCSPTRDPLPHCTSCPQLACLRPKSPNVHPTQKGPKYPCMPMIENHHFTVTTRQMPPNGLEIAPYDMTSNTLKLCIWMESVHIPTCFPAPSLLSDQQFKIKTT